MPTFIALYRGKTVGESKIVAVSADPALVADVSGRLLGMQHDDDGDPVLQTVVKARRRALRLIKNQAKSEQEDSAK